MTSSDGCSDSEHVEPNSEHVLLRIPPKAHVKFPNGKSLDGRVLTLHVEGAIQAIDKVIVDKTGVYVYDVMWPLLASTSTSTTAPTGAGAGSHHHESSIVYGALIVDVTADGRSKYVTIRSNMRMRNATGQDLYWKFTKVDHQIADLQSTNVVRSELPRDDDDCDDDSLDAQDEEEQLDEDRRRQEGAAASESRRRKAVTRVVEGKQKESHLPETRALEEYYVPLHYQTNTLLLVSARGYRYSMTDTIKVDESTLMEQQGLIMCAAETASSSSSSSSSLSPPSFHRIDEHGEGDDDGDDDELQVGHFIRQDQHRHFNCSLKVVKTTTRTKNRDDIDEFEIIFKAPLLLENMLPYTVSCIVQNGRNTFRVRARPGHPEHRIAPVSSFRFGLKPAGCAIPEDLMLVHHSEEIEQPSTGKYHKGPPQPTAKMVDSVLHLRT